MPRDRDRAQMQRAVQNAIELIRHQREITKVQQIKIELERLNAEVELMLRSTTERDQ